MASSLNHPHIVTVYDRASSRTAIPGDRVRRRRHAQGVGENRSKRTCREMCELLTGVADGLATAHQPGFCIATSSPINPDHQERLCQAGGLRSGQTGG